MNFQTAELAPGFKISLFCVLKLKVGLQGAGADDKTECRAQVCLKSPPFASAVEEYYKELTISLLYHLAVLILPRGWNILDLLRFSTWCENEREWWLAV